MSKVKRLRLFAGPNGSGKSTLFETIKDKFHVGHFINSDLIEKEIRDKGFIDLSRYGIRAETSDFDAFLLEANTQSLFQKAAKEGHQIDVTLVDNIIVDKSKTTHSYEASFITSFIRHLLQVQGQSFSFETVMSHPSKLDEILAAQQKGYKTYMYFVCIEDPTINISRIENRVEKGGHPVPQEKVLQRYTNTLTQLIPAIKLVDKAYLFDNSTQSMHLFAKAKDGEIEIVSDKIPNWFVSQLEQNQI